MADISDNPNIISQAGDYNLNTVKILSYRKNEEEGRMYEMDIKQITTNIELTEDIFSGFIHGSLLVYDSQDVRSVLPITGLEKLELSFNTPGLPGVNAVRDEGHPYHIYKIEGAQQDKTNPRAQYYQIYFCSKEMYFNSFNRISQAFSGPVEEGVQKILHSKDGLNSKKRFIFEPTKTNTKYVIPNLKPFDAIKLMGNNATSGSYNNTGYVFYEATNGFFFRSIESMLALGGSVARPAAFKYNYQITNTSSNDVENDLLNVIRYEFKRPANVLFNLNEGMIASRMITHDTFNKTISETNFDYLDSYGKFFHTEHEDGFKAKRKSVLPIAHFEDTEKDLAQQHMAKLMVGSSTSKIHDHYEKTDPATTVQNRLSQRLQMRNVNLSLQVYGNTMLHAGDIITFDMPLMRPLSDSKAKSQSNPYWSGRYLIMAIKHNISVVDERHEMSLKCMKDAVRSEFDPQLNQTIISEKEYNTKLMNIYELDKEQIKNDLLEGI
tara:strand:- start:238 stop:1719 length:1482 start_codon:yes stop_codon:yes gene_type:complete